MQGYALFELSLIRADHGDYLADVRYRLWSSIATSRPLSGRPRVAINPAELLAHALDYETYGALLTRALFADSQLAAAFARARAQAETARVPLRLILRLPADTPDLHDLAWELLHDPERGGPLFTSQRLLLSRVIDSPDMTPIERPELPALRAGVLVAAPRDLDPQRFAPIYVDAEVAMHCAALEGLAPAVAARGHALAPTLATLQLWLDQGIDLLFILCHGVRHAGEGSSLLLEDADGAKAPCTGEQLASLFARHPHRPLLVVLTACNSVVAHDEGALSAVGPRLAAAGVPAVVAMQGNIAQASARRFLPEFIRELRSDGVVDRALAAARSRMGPREGWWQPALFLRVDDGALWCQRGAGPPSDARIGGAPEARWSIPPITLAIRFAGKPPQRYRSLPQRDEVLVGRVGRIPPDLDLWPDDQVALAHLRLRFHLGTWWAEPIDQNHTLLNGAPLQEATPLQPRDQIRLGRTELAIDFASNPFDGGTFGLGPVEAAGPHGSDAPAEDRLLSAFTQLEGLLGALAFVADQRGRLEAIVRELGSLFPNAAHIAILLPQDQGRQLVPVAHWPAERSFVSFTVARLALARREASLWHQGSFDTSGRPLPPSFQGISSAIYAPIIYGDQAIGVIHCNTVGPEHLFTERDRVLLQYVAQLAALIVGAAGAGITERLPLVYIAAPAAGLPLAERLAADLRRRRIRAVFDERRRADAAWLAQLNAAIDRAGAVVVVAGPAPDAGLLRDLHAASAAGKPTLVVSAEPSPGAMLPAELSELLPLSLYPDYEAGLVDLADALTDLGNIS